MRTYSFHNSLARHPELTGSPVSVSALRDHFAPTRRSSCKSLLIKMGPFIGATDAFQFPNAFPLTAEASRQLISFFESEVESVVQDAIERYTNALNSFSIDLLPVDIPLVDDVTTVSLPQDIIDYVIGALTLPIRSAVGELMHLASSGTYGRCGGMAFAAYDYYQDGRQAADFGAGKPPEDSTLGGYVLARLINSLELNARKFVDWLMVLYVLPNIDELATATLLAAAGDASGPIGAAIGAWIGSQVDIFDLGGAGALLDMTKTELKVLKGRLDEEAAWPIGLIFGGKKNPLDQHQLLAIGYESRANNRLAIKVWDNRDANGQERRMILDLSGGELQETGVENVVKGVFVEEYTPKHPPPGP